MTADYMLKLVAMLFEGMLVSLQIFGLTLIFAVPLGFAAAFGRKSKHRLISAPIRFYILIMRGTPLILQIIFVYFGPYFLIGLSYSRFIAVNVAFILNYAAYFAEIFRGGIESMPPGQYEAAESLGLTKGQTFVSIILPQVIKRILPASSNEVITLVKDTALAQVIGITELFALASKQTNAKSSVVPLFVAGVFYFILNWAVTSIFTFFEKKLNYYR